MFGMGLDGFIRAGHIAQPLERVYACELGDSSEKIGAELRERHFSNCPVLLDGEPVGIFSALSSTVGSLVGDVMSRVELRSVISADSQLPEAGRKLLVFPFLFIMEGSRVTGFLTEADFGSAGGKSFVYLKLAGVEQSLCRYLRIVEPNGEMALNSLTAKRQSNIKNLIELLSAADKFIDHYAAFSVSDLLQLAGRRSDIREACKELGIGWTGLPGGIPDLRDDVMHADRPLLHSKRDLSSLLKKLEHLESIQQVLNICLDRVR